MRAYDNLRAGVVLTVGHADLTGTIYLSQVHITCFYPTQVDSFLAFYRYLSCIHRAYAVMSQVGNWAFLRTSESRVLRQQASLSPLWLLTA